MSSNTTFFSNNTPIPTPRETNKIIVDDHMILIIDGEKYIKEELIHKLNLLKKLIIYVENSQGEHNVKGNNESTN